MGIVAGKKSEKKERILNTAAVMFREKGFAASSMRDLAEKIGVEAASLYNHIHSKAQILEDIINDVSENCTRHLTELEKKENASALDKIESIIRFHVQMMVHRFEAYSVMVQEWMHLEEARLNRFALERRNYVKRIEQIVAQGIKNGEIKNITPYVIVLNILFSVRGLEFWQRSAKTHSEQEMEDHMVRHLIGGIKQ